MFAVGFVAFGVGSDVQGGLADLVGGRTSGTGGPSADDARERLAENPKDAQALRDLATALETDGETEAAIAPLERYVNLRPREEDALRELAGLHLARAGRLQSEAAEAQGALQALNPGADFLPAGETPLGRALARQPVSEAVSTQANQRFSESYTAMQAAFGNAKETYARLAKLAPEDPSIQFQLADTALNAGDTATAVAAFERFLKLAPDDPNAPAIRQELQRLKQSAGGAPVTESEPHTDG